MGGGLAALRPPLQERETATWQASQGKDSASVTLFKKEQGCEKQFYDAGGLLVAGTDPTGAGRTIAGYANRGETELLVEGSFTPLEAIKICTLSGARYLGHDRDIGTLEAGKQANLILVANDPGKDIR